MKIVKGVQNGRLDTGMHIIDLLMSEHKAFFWPLPCRAQHVECQTWAVFQHLVAIDKTPWYKQNGRNVTALLCHKANTGLLILPSFEK